MKVTLTLIIALLTPILARADIVTSVTCSATGFATVTDPTACSIPAANTQAQVSGTLSAPVLGSPGSAVGASFGAGTSSYPPCQSFGSGCNGTATAVGSANLSLYTVGPVRSGFIEFTESVIFGAAVEGDQTQTASFVVGSLQTTCQGPPLPFVPFQTVCTGNLGAGSAFVLDQPLRLSGTVPFTLGQAFSFSDNFVNDVSSDFLTGLETAGGTANFSFILLEADGVTPVQIFQATPEPGTWGLLACGLIGLMGIRRAKPRRLQ